MQEASIDDTLFVCECTDVFYPHFDGNFIPEKDVLNLLFIVLDDQSSLENAFPNELTLLSEPVWMNFQILKEKKGKVQVSNTGDVLLCVHLNRNQHHL